MTTVHVDTTLATKEAARLEKNARIKATMKETRQRRATQTCRVFDLKIITNNLSNKQKEALERVFLEAKWLRNDCLANGIDTYTPSGSVTVKTPSSVEQRPYKVLGSQMKQSVIQQLKNDRKGLAAKKKNGCKVGKLGFVTHVDSIDLKQYGTTYRFTNSQRTRIRVQNIPKPMRVRGTQQIPDNVEFANAKLVHKPDGYHILITTYLDSDHPYLHNQEEYAPGSMVGIDMGLKTALTYSDGTKQDVFVGETDRLKRLQKKLSRQHNGSNNRHKTILKIRREYQKIVNARNDIANKTVHNILRNEVVFMQDENLVGWKNKDGHVRGGKVVQNSVLGRVKAKLVQHPRVVVLPRTTPTTQSCPCCGKCTKHPPAKRIYTCQYCGCTADRDVHAARNMIRFGAQLLSPMERRLALVEGLSSAPTAPQGAIGRTTTPMKQEAPTL